MEKELKAYLFEVGANFKDTITIVAESYEDALNSVLEIFNDRPIKFVSAFSKGQIIFGKTNLATSVVNRIKVNHLNH